MFSFRSAAIIKAAVSTVSNGAKIVPLARTSVAVAVSHQIQRLNHSSTGKNDDQEIYYKLKDQVALVTGSTKGIGFEIARRLVESGALVVISSRNEENVQQAVKELQKVTGKRAEIAGHVCHVGNKEQRSALLDFTLKHFGGIDIFVSNAAVNPAKSHILETSDEVFEKILAVNLIAPFSLSKDIVPHMVKRGGGNIIYIGSASGYMYQGAQNLSERMAAYAISKTALLGLTKAVAGKCAPLNIRVNCVAPGLIETDFAVSITGSPDYPGSFLPLQTIKRIGRAEEVAGMVAFLCSKDASYISGETCTVAGGNGTRL